MKRPSFLLASVAIAIALLSTTAWATPEADLAELVGLKRYVAPAVAGAIDAVASVSAKVTAYHMVPTSGNAARRFDDNNVCTGYDVNYQADEQKQNWERVGNLAHELMHAANCEAYGKDFINYGNAPTKVVPAPVYAKKGDCKRLMNEADLQTKQLVDGAMTKLTRNVTDLKGLVAGSKLPTDKQTLIKNKLDYACQWPHIEYDTCLTQVAIWCQYWQTSTSTPFYKRLVELLADANTRRATKAVVQ